LELGLEGTMLGFQYLSSSSVVTCTAVAVAVVRVTAVAGAMLRVTAVASVVDGV
jgi:hypothetical protein